MSERQVTHYRGDSCPGGHLLDGVTKAVTLPQPYADLVVAGIADVLSLGFGPPSTLPQWWRCPDCESRWQPTYDHFEPVCWGIPDEGMGHFATEMIPDGPFPFTIAIHAAAQEARHDYETFLAWSQAYGDDYGQGSRLGAIVGVVTITGAHQAKDCARRFHDARRDPCCYTHSRCSRWAEPDRQHWTPTDPARLDTPIPARGRTGLWQVPSAVDEGATA